MRAARGGGDRAPRPRRRRRLRRRRTRRVRRRPPLERGGRRHARGGGARLARHPRWWACVSAASAAAEADAASRRRRRRRRVAVARRGVRDGRLPPSARAGLPGQPPAEGSAHRRSAQRSGRRMRAPRGACRPRRQRRPRRPRRPWPIATARPESRHAAQGRRQQAHSSELASRVGAPRRRAARTASGRRGGTAARPARAPKPAAISTDELTVSCDGSDISTCSETSSAQARREQREVHRRRAARPSTP